MLHEAYDLYQVEVVNQGKIYQRYADDFVYSHEFHDSIDAWSKNEHQKNFHILDSLLTKRRDLVEQFFSKDNVSEAELMEMLHLFNTTLPSSRNYVAPTKVREATDYNLCACLEHSDLALLARCCNEARVFSEIIDADDLHSLLDGKMTMPLHSRNNRLVAFFFENDAARHHDVPAGLVDLDNLEVEFLTDEGVDVRDLTEVDLGTRQEGVDAEQVDNHTALDTLGERTAHDFVVFESGVDAVPHAHEVGLLLGEDETSVFIFKLFDKHFDFGTDFEGVRVLEFSTVNDTFGLVVHVDQDFLVVHLADLTGNELALFQAVHAGVDVGVGLAEVGAAFALGGEDFSEIFLSSEFEILRHMIFLF